MTFAAMLDTLKSSATSRPRSLRMSGAATLPRNSFPPAKSGRATVIARENAILCGTAWFERCFTRLDPAIVVIVWKAQDGQRR
jgi:nicotinate-nucleotide pyrophosphorylase